MELWIRSQDKEILLKVNELEIEENMIIAFDNSKYQCLGTYKTKERALEVLDKIQKTMMSRKGILTTLNKKEEFIPFENQVIIYEMPKE